MKNKTLVLITHYNEPDALYKSINSFSEHENIDVLVIDDGSKIKPDYEILKSYFKAKGKIILKLNELNQGVEVVPNEGLNHALEQKYTYVARMDCGDFCKPDRFIKQEVFLDDHPEIGMVGTQVRFFDVNSHRTYIYSVPCFDDEIRKKMYFNAMLIQPSIMFRTSCLEKTGLYPSHYEAAEDLAFFYNFMKHYKLANLNEVLLECALNPNGISGRKRKTQVLSRMRLILDNFYFGFYPIVGLISSVILYIVPYSFIKLLKYKFKS